MKRVKARMGSGAARPHEGVERWMRTAANLTGYQGYARFTGPRRVAVGPETLEADRIFVNVGARPSARGIDDTDGAPHLARSTMMDLGFAPAPHRGRRQLCETGVRADVPALRQHRVTIVAMGTRLIGREDDDFSREVQAIA